MEAVTALPREVREVENVWIPMPDGVRLAAKLWLPEGAERAPVPAVLEYIPYRKRDASAPGDAAVHRYLAGHGYACVRADVRGSGDSDGVLEDEYLEQELSDGLEILRWIAAQDWCSGPVGMMGISWGGFNALQIAALRPPELAAIVTCCSTDDRYADDVHFMGGCLLGDNLSWASHMFSLNSLPPDPEVVGERWRDMWLQRLEGSGLWLEKWLRHQRRDAYWRHGSVCEDLSRIQCPVLAVSGWSDGYTDAVLRLLEGLDAPRQGLIGPWGHKYPHTGVPGPAIGFLQELVRWWDHWLKGVDRGLDGDPALRAWVQDEVPPTTYLRESPGRWVAEDRWPSPRVEDRRFVLGPGWLEAEGGEEPPELEVSVRSPLSVGLYAGKWCSFSATPDLPHDQREEDGGALVFDSAPLAESIEVLGKPAVELELASSEPVAMVAVRLSSVGPDDEATRVTYGLLNLTHRDGHAEPEPLEPGRRYRVRVPLKATGQRFPAGRRIRLSISTSYWPIVWPAPRPARLTMVSRASVLHLPVRPPDPSDDALRPFGPPVAAPELPTTRTRPRRYDWLVTRDLARDRSTLEVVKDEGALRYEWLDLERGKEVVERYSYEANDYDSVRGEARAVQTLQRGGWSIRSVTRTVLTSTPQAFRILAELDAYEGEKRFFSRSWDVEVPRDHL